MILVVLSDNKTRIELAFLTLEVSQGNISALVRRWLLLTEMGSGFLFFD